MDLVVEGLRPSDQTLPVAKPPSELVVEGLRPSDQTLQVAKPPSELVVEGLRPSDHRTVEFHRNVGNDEGVKTL